MRVITSSKKEKVQGLNPEVRPMLHKLPKMSVKADSLGRILQKASTPPKEFLWELSIS